jgi:zinc transport system permease protein
LSIIFTLTGLWLSYVFNLTSGASIILVAGTGFLVALGLDWLLAVSKGIRTLSSSEN